MIPAQMEAIRWAILSRQNVDDDGLQLWLDAKHGSSEAKAFANVTNLLMQIEDEILELIGEER